MTYVNITLALPNLTVKQADALLDMTNADTLDQTINLLTGASARIYPATITITTTGTNPAITTDGTPGSLQKIITKT